MCQMNMMQIMLQKISRRSKVIRKQERIVNENLKRKRIYLEKEKFTLMKKRNEFELIKILAQTRARINFFFQKLAKLGVRHLG